MSSIGGPQPLEQPLHLGGAEVEDALQHVGALAVVLVGVPEIVIGRPRGPARGTVVLCCFKGGGVMGARRPVVVW
ncbi:hypothetical protein PG991_001642 [Apiospora marii]|uniref:Uncharacterized protein n=1 Tax=Apiospora marii TaxID=335849 RepID=A0ABR1SQ96_9PEZI